MLSMGRRLSRHLLCMPLLAVRVCTLPLVFLACKIAMRQGLLALPTVHTPASSRRDRRRRSNHIWRELPQKDVVGCFAGDFLGCLCRPLHLAYVLYRLAGLIEKNPHMLHEDSLSLITACETRERGTDSAVNAVEEDNPSTSQVPATASQIYHAAITNSRSLEILLSDLSDAKAEDEVQTKQKSKHQECIAGCRETRYQDVGVQTYLGVSASASIEPHVTELNPISGEGEATYRTSDRSSREVKSNTVRTCSGISDTDAVPPEAEILDTSSLEREHETDTGTKLCPRYERRHGRSMIPQKIECGQIIAPEEDLDMTIPSLTSKETGHIKRNKLHRRNRR